MSVDSEKDVQGLKRAGRVVALTLKAMGEAVREGITTRGAGPGRCRRARGAWHAWDGWTISSVDGSLTAHYEHTMVITKGRPLLLTAA